MIPGTDQLKFLFAILIWISTKKLESYVSYGETLFEDSTTEELSHTQTQMAEYKTLSLKASKYLPWIISIFFLPWFVLYFDIVFVSVGM